MRDLILSMILVGLFPTCFRRPYIGLLVFSWLAYMRVQDLTFGFAKGIRWSFYVALLTFAGFFAGRKERFFLGDMRCWIMILLAVLVGLGILLSENPSAHQFTRYIEYVKIIAIALFTTAVVKDLGQLRILLWVIALSLGFYGVKSGVAGVVTLGRMEIHQGPGGMLRDNNDFSLALCMAVPMLWHLGLSEKREVLRKAFLIAVPLTMMTILMTHSRGGMLALTGTLSMLIWRSKNRVGGFSVMALCGVLVVLAAPADLKDRAASIGDFQNDSSANARFRAWAVATRMAVDNPLFGVGFEKFRQHYMRYEPNPTSKQLEGDDVFVAHNSYLQVWAECGTPALVLYLTLVGMSLSTIWRVRRRARILFYRSWMENYANMFEASIVAFLIGSTFLNRAHFDLFYHWVAIMTVWGVIAQQEMDAYEAAPHRFGKAGRGELVSSRRRGFDRRPVVRGFRPAVPLASVASLGNGEL